MIRNCSCGHYLYPLPDQEKYCNNRDFPDWGEYNTERQTNSEQKPLAKGASPQSKGPLPSPQALPWAPFPKNFPSPHLDSMKYKLETHSCGDGLCLHACVPCTSLQTHEQRMGLLESAPAVWIFRCI